MSSRRRRCSPRDRAPRPSSVLSTTKRLGRRPRDPLRAGWETSVARGAALGLAGVDTAGWTNCHRNVLPDTRPESRGRSARSHDWAPRGVRIYLGAVDRDQPDPDQPGLGAESQHVPNSPASTASWRWRKSAIVVRAPVRCRLEKKRGEIGAKPPGSGRCRTLRTPALAGVL